MDYLFEYLLFTAKLATALLLLVAPLLVALAARRRALPAGTLRVRKLNEQALAARRSLEAAMLPRKAHRALLKADARARKRAARGDPPASRVFVCRYVGDLRASAVAGLRDEIGAILAVAGPGDEVIVVLESAGGSVPGYGLAAAQLDRVRGHGMKLTVIVDRVAASGGYLMACVAHELVAAPFALVGSIGVVAELPNFHRLLKEHAIDYEQVTAGEFKRTLSLFGENTPGGRAKVQAELDEMHGLFKEFVLRYRPGLDLARVATGEYWPGIRAHALGLVDRVATSDEILAERMAAHDVYEVAAQTRRTWRERLSRRWRGGAAPAA
jgi:serine protease SohB